MPVPSAAVEFDAAMALWRVEFFVDAVSVAVESYFTERGARADAANWQTATPEEVASALAAR